MINETFTIDSNSKELRPLRQKIDALLKQVSLAENIQKDILVAVGEGCTNAIRHAYKGEAGHPIYVTLQEEEKKILIRIRDLGQKIDVTKIKIPELPPEKPGGLGIYFMQTMMDQIEYNTTHEQGNELILTKFKITESKE